MQHYVFRSGRLQGKRTMLPELNINGLVLTINDLDILERLCRVRERKQEYVIIGNSFYRDKLIQAGYVKTDLTNDHCWATMKLRRNFRLLEKCLVDKMKEEDEIPF